MAEKQEAPISKAQIKCIHVLCALHGIADERYREILQRLFAAGSCKQLTRKQATVFIRKVSGPQPWPKSQARPRQKKSPSLPHSKDIVALPTAAQRELSTALAEEIQWREKDGYRLWLKKNMGMGSVATQSAAAMVITGLKAIKRRQSDE